MFRIPWRWRVRRPVDGTLARRRYEHSQTLGSPNNNVRSGLDPFIKAGALRARQQPLLLLLDSVAGTVQSLRVLSYELAQRLPQSRTIRKIQGRSAGESQRKSAGKGDL